MKKHLGLTNVLAAAMLSSVISFALYGKADPRSLMIFCLVCGFSEVFIYVRWRVGVVCTMCGFDPVIYKRSPEQAARRVREFFYEHMDDPRFQLTKSPLLEWHRRLRQAQRKKMALRSSVVASKAPVVDPKGP